MSVYIMLTYLWCLLQNGLYACETISSVVRSDIQAHHELVTETIMHVYCRDFGASVSKGLVERGVAASNETLLAFMEIESRFAKCVIIRQHLKDILEQLTQSWRLCGCTQLHMLRRMNYLGRRLKSCSKITK